ncbi:hypothetical protein CMI46_02970 [Candidatus Pacearchaeota archaeon]|nr:hypothetical protein [Candidatus Pacearchaeota archaeon]|tara:strand:+ start:3242 stop:4429 length:1188 start_codon:yes stop_codon:yes gene_type:complete
MAKISPVSIKYMIHAKFEAIGPVEKPDVIGALFGQTEGLLGSELEIRELQKSGKIGRIEVETESVGSKTNGKIQIPTALDQNETSLIAAAIETIDRVGPTEATIEVERIEDVRGNKRDYIIERAKKLLGGIEGSQSSREISDTLRVVSRTSKVQTYGDDKLPCGDISGEEVIVVEGRADVMNLLENRVDNVICMNGTKLPKSIIELSKGKKIILFADGDRGGKLIAKNVIENANIESVAFAPDGKEVEELSGKEILASLRKKIPAEEFMSSAGRSSTRSRFVRTSVKKEESVEEKEVEKEVKKKELDKDKLYDALNKVEGSKKVYFFDDELNVLKTATLTKAAYSLEKEKGVSVVAVDGKATPVIVKAAEKSGVQIVAAKNFVDTSSEGVEFVSF